MKRRGLFLFTGEKNPPLSVQQQTAVDLFVLFRHAVTFILYPFTALLPLGRCITSTLLLEAAPLSVSSAICVPKSKNSQFPFTSTDVVYMSVFYWGNSIITTACPQGFFFFSSCDITFLFVDTSMVLRKCNTNPKECRLFWSPSHLLWLPDVRSHTNILD